MLCVASCGRRPAGEVELTLKSGTVIPGTLLSVEKDAALFRPSDPMLPGNISHIRLDSIASVRRAANVSGAAVWICGVIGGFAGLGLFAWVLPSIETTYDQGDTRTIGPSPVVIGVVLPLSIIAGTAFGIWVGTHIHGPDKIVRAEDANFEAQLRSLAVDPKGLPSSANRPPK